MSVFSDPNNPAKVDSSFSPATAAMSDDDMTFTKEDVIEAIDEVNLNAASGPDEIPIRVLKECNFGRTYLPYLGLLIYQESSPQLLQGVHSNPDTQKGQQVPGSELPPSVPNLPHCETV